MKFRRPYQILLLAASVSLLPAKSRAQERWTGGVTHVDTVAAPSLRGNLIGDPSRKEVTVYLPPGYATERHRRYPVIYLLHGFAADHRQFMSGQYQGLNVRVSMDSLIARGVAEKMIVVMPNADTFFGGSFYMNSPVTGKWEDFIVSDLVSYVDRKYRTVRNRSGRGIAGHSMGGFGALRVAMRNPSTYSAVYAMSPCCLGAMDRPERAAGWKAALSVKDREDYAKAGFTANLIYALAAANSPNPSRPPLFADLPFRVEGENLVPVPEVSGKWRAGPLAMVPSHLNGLRRMSIAFDAGNGDGLTDIPVNVRTLDSLLTAHGVPHEAEIYEGDHGNRVRSRLETKVFPFFSRLLK
ncbi:MAG: alpha/beta hydrolase [Gemmatimonadaceae bacterium]